MVGTACRKIIFVAGFLTARHLIFEIFLSCLDTRKKQRKSRLQTAILNSTKN